MSARGKLTNQEIGLAFLIGGGFLLMAFALGLGALFGAQASDTNFGMIFFLGLIVFLAGVALWLVIVEPWKQFDDINVPKDAGHHAAAEHPGETAAGH